MGCFLFAITALFLVAAQPASAEVRLTVDATQPYAVFEALDRRESSPELLTRLAAMPGTVSAIEHHRQFTTDISFESWKASIADAIDGRPRRDPYRFDSLIQNRDVVRANIARIVDDQQAFSGEVAAIITPYMPPDMDLDARVVFVVGSGGNGWVRRQGEFFFDIGGAQGDLEGAKVVAAHEVYHLVLAQLMPESTLPSDDPLGRIERVLRNGINEGMAIHVARHRTDTGALARRNMSFEQVNIRRMAANFRLVETFLLATYHDPEITSGDAGRIIFSGVFTEPGYYVFRMMAETIEKSAGRERLMQLIAGPPSRFVLAYHDLAAPDQPRLSDTTLAVVRQLDAAVS